MEIRRRHRQEIRDRLGIRSLEMGQTTLPRQRKNYPTYNQPIYAKVKIFRHHDTNPQRRQLRSPLRYSHRRSTTHGTGDKRTHRNRLCKILKTQIKNPLARGFFFGGKLLARHSQGHSARTTKRKHGNQKEDESRTQKRSGGQA